MGLPRLAVAGVLGVSLLAACGTSTPSFGTPAVAEACRVGTGITADATTTSYIVKLDIGPVEAMYSQAQVDSQHPGGGEVMLRGQMSPASGGSGAATAHHLEAHICSKAGGAVIQDANPTISLTNDASKDTQNVPVAVMQGVSAGVGDLHYGNNVLLAPGSAYTVVVSLNGEVATLHVQVPTAPASTNTTTVNAATDMPGMPGMHGPP